MTLIPPTSHANDAECHRSQREERFRTTTSSNSALAADVDDFGPLADASTQRNRVLPPWLVDQIDGWGERVTLPEWDADEKITLDEHDDVDGSDLYSPTLYRKNNGWSGSDLCHSLTSPVRISHYAVQYTDKNGGVGTKLTGLAHFTPNAESHSGFCHGGSMTSVMDDVIGWVAFHTTGKCIPWSGFTAQVNVSLKRPIPVGAYLKIFGEITKVERRKVWITSYLVSGNDDQEVYCAAEGLAILKK